MSGSRNSRQACPNSNKRRESLEFALRGPADRPGYGRWGTGRRTPGQRRPAQHRQHGLAWPASDPMVTAVLQHARRAPPVGVTVVFPWWLQFVLTGCTKGETAR